jgi:hypothetical protein
LKSLHILGESEKHQLISAVDKVDEEHFTVLQMVYCLIKFTVPMINIEKKYTVFFIGRRFSQDK